MINQFLQICAKNFKITMLDGQLLMGESPVFFVNDGCFCKITNVSVVGQTIEASGSVNGNEKLRITITTQNNAISIKVSSDNNVSIMWPAVGEETYFGDLTKPISNTSTCSASYGAEPYSDTISMNVPCSHHKGMSIFALTEPVCYRLFTYHTQAYCSAESGTPFEITIVPVDSMQQALSWWHSLNVHIIATTQAVTIDQKKEIIFNAHLINDKGLPSVVLLKMARDAQEILRKNKIDNCIIGSLALSLHGISTKVQDVDIAVKSHQDLEKSIAALKNDFHITYPATSSKWHGVSFRAAQAHHVDVCFLKNFSCESVDLHRLIVLNKHDLLMMKLIQEIEFQDMKSTGSMMNLKNRASLISLLRSDQPLLYPFFAEELDKYDNRFKELYDMVGNGIWHNLQIDINKPLMANCFKLDKNLMLPIINHDAPCEGILKIGCVVLSAKWHPLEHDASSICEVQEINGVSRIFIEKVEELGVLEAEIL